MFIKINNEELVLILSRFFFSSASSLDADLALVANGKQELQETLEEWNGLFTRHGLKINVLHIGHQREELDIELEGKKLTQGDSFVYLEGTVCGDGNTSKSTGWSERVESS